MCALYGLLSCGWLGGVCAWRDYAVGNGRGWLGAVVAQQAAVLTGTDISGVSGQATIAHAIVACCPKCCQVVKIFVAITSAKAWKTLGIFLSCCLVTLR